MAVAEVMESPSWSPEMVPYIGPEDPANPDWQLPTLLPSMESIAEEQDPISYRNGSGDDLYGLQQGTSAGMEPWKRIWDKGNLQCQLVMRMLQHSHRGVPPGSPPGHLSPPTMLCSLLMFHPLIFLPPSTRPIPPPLSP